MCHSSKLDCAPMLGDGHQFIHRLSQGLQLAYQIEYFSSAKYFVWLELKPFQRIEYCHRQNIQTIQVKILQKHVFYQVNGKKKSEKIGLVHMPGNKTINLRKFRQIQTDRIFNGAGKSTHRTYVKCFKKVCINIQPYVATMPM